jgi:multidrug resistance efflux pump
MKILLRSLLLIGALALAIWQVRLLMRVLVGKPPQAPVETVQVKPSTFVVGLTREGTLQSSGSTELREPGGGATISWLIKDGTMVKTGTPVARLDLSQIRNQVEQNRLNVQMNENRLEQARREGEQAVANAEMEVDNTRRALDLLKLTQTTETQQAQAQAGFDQWNLKQAKGNLDKQTQLFQAGIIPQTTVESAEQQYRGRAYAAKTSEHALAYMEDIHNSLQAQSAADIDATKFKVIQAKREAERGVENQNRETQERQSQLTLLEKRLAAATLIAPNAGMAVIANINSYQSDKLKVGDAVWGRQVIVEIADLSKIDITLTVEDNAIGQVKMGQETLIKPVGIDSREFKGNVIHVGSVARQVRFWEDPDAAPDQRVFDVVVEVTKTDSKVLRPGMKAKVQFVLARLPGVLALPSRAVFDKPEGKTVYVAGPGGFKPRRVKLGKKNDEAVVITEGLKPGERVALSDPTLDKAE